MDYIKIEDIPEEFVGLANFMGIDKFIEFCNEYGGIAIYFPSKKTLLRNGRNREIIKKGKTSVLPSKNCFAILVGFPLRYEHFPIH